MSGRGTVDRPRTARRSHADRRATRRSGLLTTRPAAAAALVGLTLAVALVGPAVPPTDTGTPASAATTTSASAAVAVAPAVDRPCAAPTAGHAACLLQVGRATASSTTISGLNPAMIASAYGLSGGGSGTIAIVDAYDNPNLESDLAVYRSTWGLPACTTSNGCFRKVGQTGSATDLPAANASWGEETALDIDAASAACPACRLLVVEARSDAMSSLGTAVNTAVALGATAVSNSYGGDENGAAASYANAYFTHPGVALIASSGDSGYRAASMPAVLPGVIAVGGTTLTRTSSAAVVTPSARANAPHVTVRATAASTKVDRDIAAVKALTKSLKAAKATVQHRKASHCTSTACRRALRAATTKVHRLTTALAKAKATLATDRRKARKPAPAPVAPPTPTPAPIAAPVPVSTPTTGPAPSAPPAARGWSETVWSGSGSGCSTQVARPTWQSATPCTGRSTADVAADADPTTGLAMYDTYGTQQDTRTGWLVAGGTSLAAPLITGMLVRSGAASNYSDASALYAHAARFTDVTAGSNGTCGTSLCNGAVGYDGPTGVGTPTSLASF